MNILDIAIAKKLAGGGGGSGTDNYNDLSNLPKINDTTLSGNKSSSALGLQSEINSDSKLASDLVDDTNQDNKFVTSTEKNTWNAKQNAIDNSHKLSSDLVDDTNHTNKFVTSTEKNTWNAKQNAIDADHKLSSSLVSFSTAEAAALASGIDSSKVGQISTNQTNILLVQDATEELVNKGAKNKLDISSMETTTMRGITFSQSDGVVTTSGNNDNTGASYVDIATLSGTQMQTLKGHILSGSVNKSGYSIFISRKASPGNTVVTSEAGSPSDPIPDNIDYECVVTVYIPQGTTQSAPTKFYPMLCSEAEWKISHEFEPYALSNSELTKLAKLGIEDKNSIQRLVYDGGGRNILKLSDLSVIKSQCGTLSVSMSDDYTLTVSGSDTSAHFANIAIVTPSKTGDYTFSSVDGDVNKCAAYIKIGDGYYWAYSGFTSKIPMVAGTSYTVVLRYLANTTGTYNFKFMLREADIADTTYQPYALPNYDLTYREQQDRNALVEVVDKGAKNILPPTDLIPEGDGLSNNPNLTCTNNGDGTYTLNGSTVENGTIIIYYSMTSDLYGGYMLSGCPNINTDSEKCRLSIYTYTAASGVCQDSGQGKEIPTSFDPSFLAIYVFAGNTFNNVKFYPMICTKEEFKISPSYQPYTLPNTDLTRMVNDLQKKAVKVYTYHVNPNESDPEDAVTYLDDATGLTPAKMGASSFSYGSWANAWFLPRPCVLKFDGTVDYYLDPNDYSKKTDGTASTIDSSNSTGNVMLEFPKIWVKRVNDGNGARTVSIAPVNVDGTYKCWSNINAEDKEVDHFYLPAYNGTIHSSKMRSLSGVTLNSTYAPNKTRAEEVTLATANNPTGKNMWYTETWADMCLVFDLLYLMGKSLNLQGTFGNGLATGSETAMRAYVTGSLNDKGLFYGDISGQATGVKVLGMENLWGCRWRGVAGLINDNGALKVKMTYGVADGSTTVGYNTTGSGYLDYGSTYGTVGYVKKMQADNTMGYKIIETAGTDATYYCDYYYTNNSQLNYALMGGSAGGGSSCGFYVNVANAPANALWYVGAALSCRPES